MVCSQSVARAAANRAGRATKTGRHYGGRAIGLVRHAHHFHDRVARTAFFAQLDLSVNVLTIVVQIVLTGRALKWSGLGITLAMLPRVSLVGFVSLAELPILSLLAVFQVLRRAMNYALSRASREVLFTVLRREDKYKAKSFMDRVVYGTGDQLGAWSYPALRWLGLGMTGISWTAVPLVTSWCVHSLWLGRRQVVLADSPAKAPCVTIE